MLYFVNVVASPLPNNINWYKLP